MSEYHHQYLLLLMPNLQSRVTQRCCLISVRMLFYLRLRYTAGNRSALDPQAKDDSWVAAVETQENRWLTVILAASGFWGLEEANPMGLWLDAAHARAASRGCQA